MRAYESGLSKSLIKIVESVPGTHVYGVTDMDRLDERVPTVSFTLEGKDPERLAYENGRHGIYVWNGHNYALAIMADNRLMRPRASYDGPADLSPPEDFTPSRC